SDSSTGTYGGEYYRDAQANGWFQYDLSLAGATPEDNISVMFRYCTADAGREGNIYVDGELLCTVAVTNAATAVGGFYNAEYLIPTSMLLDDEGNLKTQLTVRMEAAAQATHLVSTASACLRATRARRPTPSFAPTGRRATRAEPPPPPSPTMRKPTPSPSPPPALTTSASTSPPTL
ncbi:MAG: hypothetical protein LUC33_00090, partial [Prevotellaceae bacterium]|nr:hypothetical protein [Prevotellaceae bacterium]